MTSHTPLPPENFPGGELDFQFGNYNFKNFIHTRPCPSTVFVTPDRPQVPEGSWDVFVRFLLPSILAFRRIYFGGRAIS